MRRKKIATKPKGAKVKREKGKEKVQGGEGDEEQKKGMERPKQKRGRPLSNKRKRAESEEKANKKAKPNEGEKSTQGKWDDATIGKEMNGWTNHVVVVEDEEKLTKLPPVWGLERKPHRPLLTSITKLSTTKS